MLFDTFELKGVTLKNRICAAPLATSSAVAGLPSERTLSFYRKIAASGAALINVEHHAVNSSGRVRIRQLMADSDEAAAAHAEVASLIKEKGGVAVAQINHAGAGIADPALLEEPGFRALSPSGAALGSIWEESGRRPDTVTLPEIAALIEDFTAAAVRMVKIAGYDGIAIHAAHGFLLGQFLSPLTNRRQDKYGGSLSGRARLLYEVIDSVRMALPDTLISVRMGAADHMPGETPRGLRVEEAAEASREAAQIGADLICVSGNMCGYGKSLDSGCYFASYAAVIRSAVGGMAAVECTGGIRSAAEAESLLAEGCCDLVGVGRPLLDDPSYLDSWRTGS